MCWWNKSSLYSRKAYYFSSPETGCVPTYSTPTQLTSEPAVCPLETSSLPSLLLPRKTVKAHAQIYFYCAYIGNMTLSKEQKDKWVKCYKRKRMHRPTPSSLLATDSMGLHTPEVGLDWLQAVGTVHRQHGETVSRKYHCKRNFHTHWPLSGFSPRFKGKQSLSHTSMNIK